MFEPSFASTPNNNKETINVLPRAAITTIAKTQTKTATDTKSISVNNPGACITHGANTPPTTVIPSGTGMMSKTKRLSESIRLFMDSQNKEGNSPLDFFPVFRDSELNGLFIFRFRTFYHPYVSAFIRELNRNGVDGLLQRKVQIDPKSILPPTRSAT